MSIRYLSPIAGMHKATFSSLVVLPRCKCEDAPAYPDKAHICMSHIERSNLNLAMHLHRFTRLANAFSKKLDKSKAVVAACVGWCNLCRVHQTLQVTPTIEAGITDHIWSIVELLTSISVLQAEA
jgi:hypothetical protein